MQVTKFYCDICGTELRDHNRSSVVIDYPQGTSPAGPVPWWSLRGEWCISCKAVMKTAVLVAVERVKADASEAAGKDNSYQAMMLEDGASGDMVFQSGPIDNRGGDTVMARHRVGIGWEYLRDGKWVVEPRPSKNESTNPNAYLKSS